VVRFSSRLESFWKAASGFEVGIGAAVAIAFARDGVIVAIVFY
jgi:hypothetical protein